MNDLNAFLRKPGDIPAQKDEEPVKNRCYHHIRQSKQIEGTLELIRLKGSGVEPHQAERVVFEWYGINPMWMASPTEIRFKACDAHGTMWLVAIKGKSLFQASERKSLWTALKTKACFLVQEIEQMQGAALGDGEAVVEAIEITEVREETQDGN